MEEEQKQNLEFKLKEIGQEQEKKYEEEENK